jgi:hypothetical protein
MNRPVYLTIGFVVLAGVYALAYLLATTTSGDDLHECASIAKDVAANHQIPPSASSPGRPGIFCDKGVHLPFLTSYDVVILYGITNRTEQDAIVLTVEEYRHESHINSEILLRFIDKESWKTWSDPNTGNKGGERGPETPTREVWIK